ncbi:hypothetical protein BCR34DRAFT_670061 [Clohesyomyces aquaticus]|uniref:Uncharacterized protein n=1 Tax=Clohesyomyces aquaticus TaxID=1231657 RepID=A0A1Y1Y2E9_9PLEO|nr:hypothetical protein BCR34DRAFT_670061 [Clohesyomyces aquaticus]
MGDELCGNALKSRGALVNYVKKHHPDVNVKAASVTGNPSIARIRAARVWYSAIIKAHHEIASTRSSKHVLKMSTPPLVRSKRSSNKAAAKNGKAAAEPVTITMLTSSDRLKIPTFTRLNKKRLETARDITFRTIPTRVLPSSRARRTLRAKLAILVFLNQLRTSED